MEITAEFLRKAGLDPKLLDDPAFVALAKEGLSIQDRFVAEPLYARTGKGYLRSVGVEEIRAAKESCRVEER
jgi:hypothetical protein